MKNSARHISLPSVDDLFSTEESRQEDLKDKVEHIPIEQLHPFRDHPFKVIEDDSMKEMAQSIRDYGVLIPAVARPDPEGGYELIAGHRRHFACQLAGVDTLPVIVKDLDDDAAVIIMVDSNLQRENILPSERAYAYKMKLDAMKRQAGRPSKENGGQVDHHLNVPKSRDILAEQTGESAKNIQRYIHLTELVPPLLDMVDEKKIAFNPAYELSFLREEEQETLLSTMEYEQATPSLSQAQRLKRFSQKGLLTAEVISAVMSEEKKEEWGNVTLKQDVLKKYFPKNYTPKRMQETIVQLLEQWQKNQSHEISR